MPWFALLGVVWHIVVGAVSANFEIWCQRLTRKFWDDTLVANSMLLQESFNGFQCAAAGGLTLATLGTRDCISVVGSLVQKVIGKIPADEAILRAIQSVNWCEDGLDLV